MPTFKHNSTVYIDSPHLIDLELTYHHHWNNYVLESFQVTNVFCIIQNFLVEVFRYCIVFNLKIVCRYTLLITFLRVLSCRKNHLKSCRYGYLKLYVICFNLS